jgi:PAS domain-containing protein
MEKNNKIQKTSKNKYYNAVALRTAFIYMVMSALWILFSDELLLSNPKTAVFISLIKGWVYTIVVGLFFYAVIARELHIRAIAEIERKKVEIELRESEELLKSSQKIAGLGSYTTDFIAGKWKSSEVMDEIFGIDSTYERSVPGWLDLVYPEDRPMMNEYLTKEVLGAGHSFDREYRIARHNDKAVRWVHGLGRLEFDLQGNPVKMIGTIQDVTACKEKENTLKLKLDEIEKLNKLMVGRELKMAELKEQLMKLGAKK